MSCPQLSGSVQKFKESPPQVLLEKSNHELHELHQSRL
jgi:hypothetical protein